MIICVPSLTFGHSFFSTVVAHFPPLPDPSESICEAKKKCSYMKEKKVKTEKGKDYPYGCCRRKAEPAV
jgi:hypothetical protein